MISEKEQQGFLFVSDITGYTAYLNQSELEHARGTLTDLMGVLIEASGRPLTVAKLEGDAVFSYGFADAFSSGQTFLELVETTYVRFRRAIASMVLNNTCQCNACANVRSLDLKFVVHYGKFLFQDFGDRTDLIGPDVNLLHRLMKNSVTEVLGVTAYCLYTEAAAEKLEIQDLDGLRDHEEHIEDFGAIRVVVQDMEPAYEQASATDGISLNEDEIIHVMEHEFPMNSAALWDYLTDPHYRNILIGTERQEITGRVGGRIDVGTVYQCYHGNKVTPQTIIEWTPFNRVVTEDTLPKPLIGKGIAVVELEPKAEGTLVVRKLGGLALPGWARVLGRIFLVPMIRRMQSQAFDKFVDVVTEDWERKWKGHRPRVSVEDIEKEVNIGVIGWTTTVDGPGGAT